LTADPAERSNLLGRAADRDRELAAALRAFGGDAPGPRVAEDTRAAAQLRSLGYVSGAAPPKAAYTAADDPKNLVEIDEAVHRAVEAFSAGRAGDAIQIYRQVVGRRPDMGIAYRHLAFIEWQQGQRDEAMATLRRALEHGVTDARVAVQLGGFLADAGRVTEGIQLLEPLARAADADSDTLNTLGIAFARAGRPGDARRAFERVLTINPESSVPLENLGVLALERNDLAAAAAYFDRAVRAAPRSSRAHAGRGAVAMKQGDKPAAYDAWTKAVQLDPTNFEALYNLGVNLAREGQKERARPYLEQFMRTAPPAFYSDDRRDVATLLQSQR
jgi:Tfp pilus assembly protein PilF